jgi:hypothetical protein
MKGRFFDAGLILESFKEGDKVWTRLKPEWLPKTTLDAKVFICNNIAEDVDCYFMRFYIHNMDLDSFKFRFPAKTTHQDAHGTYIQDVYYYISDIFTEFLYFFN